MEAGSALGGGATDCDDATAAPCPPTPGSVSTASQTSVTVTWVATTGPAATSYTVTCVSGGTCSNTSRGTQASGFTDSGLTCGTTYTYRVVAVNASGNSAASNNFSGSTSPCASAPAINSSSISSITNNSASFNANVSGNGLPTNITYRYGTSNLACGSLPSTLSGTNANFTGTVNDSKASGAIFVGNTRYYYCVVAVNGINTTSTAVSSFVTLPAAPGTPTVSYSSSINRNNVSWASSAGGGAYTLTYYLYSCSDSNNTCTPSVFEGSTTSTSSTSGSNCGWYNRVYLYASTAAGNSTYSGVGSTVANAPIACYKDADMDGDTVGGLLTYCGPSCPSNAKSSQSAQADCNDNDSNNYYGNINWYADGNDHNCDGQIINNVNYSTTYPQGYHWYATYFNSMVGGVCTEQMGTTTQSSQTQYCGNPYYTSNSYLGLDCVSGQPVYVVAGGSNTLLCQ